MSYSPDSIIPYLIDKIDDTTTTSSFVQYFGGYYTVGDIALKALNELVREVPVYDLLGVDTVGNDCGNCIYWGRP